MAEKFSLPSQLSYHQRMCRILLLCGLIAACSSKASEQSQATSKAEAPSNEEVSDGSKRLASGDDAESIDASTAVAKPEVKPEVEAPSRSPECLEACGGLLDEPFESLAEKVNQDCRIDWRDNSKDFYCRHWDHLRNCVYAAGGKGFKKEDWQEEFAEYSWYKINPSFKHDDLSANAKANIKLLKEAKLSCEEALVTKPGEPVQELSVDLNGDGKDEKIRVTTSRVFVDGKEFVHRLKPYSAPQMKLKIIDVDPDDSYKELMVTNHYYEGNAHRAVLYKRGGEAELSEVFNWHDASEVSKAKKGTIKIYSGECGQQRTEVYGFKKEVFVQISKKVKGRFREEYCSACPYVYVWEQGAWSFQGEILRNLRSIDLESTHDLPLGHRSGRIRVRLAERKDEITFVDGLELVAVYANGTEEVLAAQECKGTEERYCAVDQVHQRIERGEHIEFSFELPEPATVRLRARGYYLPL